MYLLKLMDEADAALDDDVYEQKKAADFDAPDDAEWSVRAGTIRKIEKLFLEISHLRNRRALPLPEGDHSDGKLSLDEIRDLVLQEGRQIAATDESVSYPSRIA